MYHNQDQHDMSEPLYHSLHDDDTQPTNHRSEKGTALQHYIRRSTSALYPLLPNTIRDVIVLLMQLAVAVFALVGVVHLAQTFRPRLARGTHPCRCGSSVAEALGNNCRFDFLAAAWLPPACIDQELSAEFEAAGPGPNGSWSYFADQNKTSLLRPEDIGALADDPEARYYSTKEWHIVHCFYYWRKQIRARHNDVIVEPRFDHEGHAKHCVGVFSSNLDLQDIGAVQGASLDNGEVK